MKTTHSSKALLLEASVLVFRRRFPGEPKAEGGQDHNAEAWDAFRVGHQDSPAHGGLPRPSPHAEIRTVFNGCWVKALSCGEEAVGHWQWSSMALIHHGRLQGGLHCILGGAFTFFSLVCRGALENEVAIEGFNGGHRRCLGVFSFHRRSGQFPPLLP